MDKDLAHEAIEEALRGNWKKAQDINKAILDQNPKDVDALNRLARAYSEMGKLTLAKRTAHKVLDIDPFNIIATKAIAKWKALRSGDTYASHQSGPGEFLEEPGKTKIVSLLYLGGSGVLAKLDAGDEIKLNTRSHRVSAMMQNGSYIGRLPDDLSARLKKFTFLGNEYKAFIKSIDKKDVKIFIREVKRTKSLSNVASFPPEKIDYISFTPPELVHKKKDLELEVEEEE